MRNKTMKLIYTLIIFALLLQDLLQAILATEKVNCGEDGTADTPDNLCYRNKVIEKYSRIESLKKEILSKLGLSEAPNITAPGMLPDGMLEDLGSLQAASSATHTPPYYAMPITTHTVQQTRHKFGLLQRGEEHSIYAFSYLKFNITIARKHQSIYKTNLRVQIGKELTVYPEEPTDVQKLLLYAEEEEGTEVLVLRKLIKSPADTHTLDITKLLQSLVKKSPKSPNGDVSVSFKIRIAVLKNGRKITRLVDEGKGRARIVIQSYDERDVESRRSRRAATSSFCSGRNEKNCCVRPLEINFRRDLGWDYIAQPPAFNANYCAGNCPLNWHTENNLFYDILYKYSLKNNRHIGPCCVPNEYESLTVVYFNNANEPVIAKLPNVIVRSCSCR